MVIHWQCCWGKWRWWWRRSISWWHHVTVTRWVVGKCVKIRREIWVKLPWRWWWRNIGRRRWWKRRWESLQCFLCTIGWCWTRRAFVTHFVAFLALKVSSKCGRASSMSLFSDFQAKFSVLPSGVLLFCFRKTISEYILLKTRNLDHSSATIMLLFVI